MSSMAPELKFTSFKEIDEVRGLQTIFPFCSSRNALQIYSTLNKTFRSGKTKPIAFRKVQILQLAYLLQDNLERFKEALAIDLGRPPLEASL
jgi:aldehyde dehydrogenase (NAD+)